MTPAAVPAGTSTITTANGNTFSFKLTLVQDGTGQGTTDQCFINSATGYAPGDNTPTDGIVCSGDRVRYRVDWNAVIVNTSAENKVDFTFSNTDTSKPYTFYSTNDPSAWWNEWFWNGSGVVGSPDVGFVGSGGPNNKASMTFTATGARSGFWTFDMATNIMPNEHLSVIQMAADTAMGGQIAQAIADRNATIIADGRADALQTAPRVDGFLTTGTDGTTYRGILTGTNFADPYVDGAMSEARYPGYAPGKGYFAVHGPMGGAGTNYTSLATKWRYSPTLSQPFRYSLLNAPVGTLVQIETVVNRAGSLSEIQDVQWDGTTAFVDVTWDKRVKFLIPWEPLADGIHAYQTRVDPLAPVLDVAGSQVFNDAPADPGVGLACDVTTKDVLPGTVVGVSAPNNNCGALSFEKKSGAGGFYKADLSRWADRPLPPTTMPDGTVKQDVVLASSSDSPDQDVTGKFAPENNEFAGAAFFDPKVGSKDMAVCQVWNPDELRLFNKDPQIYRSAIQGTYPTAQVYYTTKDLRPAGAPTAADETPNCGSPSDASTWSTSAPASLGDVAGVMVVFPGTNTIVEPGFFHLLLRAENQANFDQLFTDNVRNYLGVSYNTAVPTPTWGGSSDAVTVAKSSVGTDLGWELNSTIGTGPYEYTSQLTSTVTSHGAVPVGDQLVERIYLDRCMTNVSVSPITTDPTRQVISSTVVGQPDLAAGCGLSDNYYVENVYKFGDQEAVSRLNFSISWTAPATSLPGDKYQMKGTWNTDASDYYISSTNPAKTYTVAPSSVIGSVKSADAEKVEPGQPYTQSLGWFNFSETDAGQTTVIDVLPYNGDARGTKFTGTNPLSAVDYVGRTAQNTAVAYTKTTPGSVSDDPAAASNQSGGSTVWCTDLSGGDCPASLAEVTALKFTTADLANGSSQYFRLTFTPTGNAEGNRYSNQLGFGRSDQLGQPIPKSSLANTTVVASSLSGVLFGDTDNDATRDDGEPLIGSRTVTLKTPDGTTVATTTTDANGAYTFTGLPAGDYLVTFAQDDPREQMTLAGTQTGAEASDWTTEPVTVGFDADVTGVNGGVYRPRSIAGVVYFDTSANGDQDGTEVGAPGVKVTLKRPDGTSSSTTTGSDGAYLFDQLPAGKYTVEIAKADGQVITQAYLVVDPTGNTTTPSSGPVTVDDDITGVDFGLANAGALTLVKSATTPGPYATGQSVTWTYKVTNIGGAWVAGVAVTDDRGVQVSCPQTELAPGASMDCTGTGIITGNAPATPAA